MPSLAEHAQQIAAAYVPPDTGRPSDIGSLSTVREFLEAVGNGNYIDTAAKLSGLSKGAVYNWLKRGREGEVPYDAFVNAVEKAEARAEALLVQNVAKASEKEQFWAAGMTLLERRHPEKWGRRQEDGSTPKVVVQIGVSGQDVKVGIATLSPANINDLACANQGQVEMLSPINSNYVNHAPMSTSAPVLPVGASGSLAAGSQGDPTHPAGLAGGQPRRTRGKGAKARSRHTKKKGTVRG